MAKITIDTTKLAGLAKKADQIHLKPQAEKYIVQVLKAQEQINELVKQMEVLVAEAGIKLDPNFKSIHSDKLKASYRAYGAKYIIDLPNLGLAPVELYTKEEKVTYSIDTKAVEKWADEHKGMPTGIIEVAEEKRTKSLKFKLK